MDTLGGVGDWLDDLKAGASAVVESAATPLVAQAVKQATPSLNASAQSGVKQWLSENSGMLIIGVLALVAIVVGIVVISRRKK